jgi:hypothetical protein
MACSDDTFVSLAAFLAFTAVRSATLALTVTPRRAERMRPLAPATKIASSQTGQSVGVTIYWAVPKARLS